MVKQQPFQAIWNYIMLLDLRYVTATNGTANFDPEEHPPDKRWKDDFDTWGIGLDLEMCPSKCRQERHRSVDHMEFNQDYEEEAIGIIQQPPAMRRTKKMPDCQLVRLFWGSDGPLFRYWQVQTETLEWHWNGMSTLF